MMDAAIVNKIGKSCNSLKILSEDQHVDAAAWIRFIHQMHVPKIFSTLSDKRQLGKTHYKITSLVLWALSACSCRLGSKNALQASLENLNSDQRRGMLNLLEIDGNQLPHSSTVDNALATIPLEELNQVPLHLLRQLEKRKLFYNHPELLPNNALQIGCDGFWVHKYNRPHATHENGTNACPYCLPRTCHKGTDKETMHWVHVLVTFTLICNGLTLPIYVYPLKAGQLDLEQSDERLKEECELKAAHAVLPMIREKFPRMNIIFLGDALYANKPTIRLLEELQIDYIIVLKEKALKNLNRRCDELAVTEVYQRYHRAKIEERCGQGILRREACWFNQAAVGEDVFTNVLRYQDSFHDAEGTKPGYKGAWICSKRLSKENCFKRAQTGRMRWDHEDLHNTAKNRGFEIKHDMARTNPDLLFAWKMINFIAYFLFTLFQHTTVARKARGSRSWKKFAQDLLQQLINISWELICQSPLLCKPKVQFRYCFDPP